MKETRCDVVACFCSDSTNGASCSGRGRGSPDLLCPRHLMGKRTSPIFSFPVNPDGEEDIPRSSDSPSLLMEKADIPRIFSPVNPDGEEDIPGSSDSPSLLMERRIYPGLSVSQSS